VTRQKHLPWHRLHGPGCWNRDTARNGLRRLVVCTTCAAALQGQVHKRELPEGTARAIRRGAA
jgi:hypothetical protein